MHCMKYLLIQLKNDKVPFEHMSYRLLGGQTAIAYSK